MNTWCTFLRGKSLDPGSVPGIPTRQDFPSRTSPYRTDFSVVLYQSGTQKCQTVGSVPPMSSCAMSPVLLFHYHHSMEHRGKSVSYPSLRWTDTYISTCINEDKFSFAVVANAPLNLSGNKGQRFISHLYVTPGSGMALLVLALFTLGSRLMELTLSGTLLISEQRKREQGELGFASSTAHTLLTKEVK